MLNLLFNLKTSFNTYPNDVKMVDDNYNFLNSNICFGNLSKTNVFIGENNSGKSRFLRQLFATNFYGLGDQTANQFFYSFDERSYYSPYEEIPKSTLKRFETIYKRMVNNRTTYSIAETSFFERLQKSVKNFTAMKKFYFPVTRGNKNYKKVIENKLNSFIGQCGIKNTDSILHYVDLLSLHENGLNNFDIYKQITTQEYFEGKSIVGSIYTGGSLYTEIRSKLLGEETDRRLIEEFQIFLKNNFFEDYDKVQLIPNESKKTLWVKIGNDEHAIYDLGDGTQQLIIILYSLFKHKNETDCLFFIEEPEIYLHPGILRKFIEVINSDIFKNHQYFITTHSNIILDTSADTTINMSIFKFKKVQDIKQNRGKAFLIEQCNHGDVSLLNELGVRNSSVFLANCSIWVEGITDRLYLKHYLKLYYEKNKETLKEYRENLNYTFIEYGGANVIHYNFDAEDFHESINAKYVNNRIFLIADNDNTKTSTAKHERKEHYRKVLENNFYELPVVEIENLITSDVLKRVLINQNKEQSQIIEEMFKIPKSFSNKRLGKYIDKLFESVDKMKKYSAASGTIKNKLEFCNAVIQETTDYDMLSDEAKDLVEKIYLFIQKNNLI